MELLNSAMRLEKYIRQVSWNELNKEFIRCGYNGKINHSFKKAFYELKKKQAIPDSRIINLYEGETWAYYSMTQNEDDFQELLLIPWANCLGMEVKVKDTKMSHAEIVMHCLWSLTYMGFSEKQINWLKK